jgi:hypothetical protein
MMASVLLNREPARARTGGFEDVFSPRRERVCQAPWLEDKLKRLGRAVTNGHARSGRGRVERGADDAEEVVEPGAHL